MNQERKIVAVFIISLLVFGLAMNGFAGHHMKDASKSAYHKGLKDKFFNKAHFILKKKDELGLSPETADKIRNMMREVQKELIMKEAQIESIAVDIKDGLWNDPIDLNAINALIDQKYDIKKEKAKSLVNSFATLKGALSDEQKTKLKTLYKEAKKDKGSSYHKGSYGQKGSAN